MGLKTQNSRFPCKIALLSKKVCYKVYLCENRQRQSCKAFIGFLSVQKMGGGDVPFYAKIWPKLTHLFKNADYKSIFVRSASAVTPGEKLQSTRI